MYYLAYYGDVKHNEQRANFPAATTKVDYISDIVSNDAQDVVIISPSITTSAKKSFGGDLVKKKEGVFVKLFPSHGFSTKIGKKFMKLYTDFLIFCFLKKNCNEGDPIIIYHSLSLLHMVLALKFFLKMKVILEVEEIYQDVVKTSLLKRKLEYKIFECADAYIFSTKALNSALNHAKKPFVVINGTYRTESKRQASFQDNQIHCVYAGTFEAAKGGAAAAIEAARYLPENYVVHILGFGTKEEVNHILRLIEQVQKSTKCKIAYQGLLTGDEYTKFLQQCHIGLCTQIPDQKYVNTSFPSKVLVYLSNGLRVLSADMPVVRDSSVGELLWYYHEQTPEAIAAAIQSIDLHEDYQPDQFLFNLNVQCEKNLKKMIERVRN